MWGQHTTQLERFFVVAILPFHFFSTFLQVKITPSDPSLDKSWTNTTELIMNNRNPEFNQTLVIEVCIAIYKQCINKLNLRPLCLGNFLLNVRLKCLQKVNKEKVIQSTHPRGPQLTLTVLDWDVTNHRRPIASTSLPLVGDGQVRTKKLDLFCTSFWGCLFG